MREKIGEQYSGTVSGIAPFGVFITLDSLFVEGMVHVSELGTEYFQYNEALNELRGERTGQRYRLGDQVNVQVGRVDIEARKIDFRLVRATGFNEVAAALRVPEAPAKKAAGKAANKTSADKTASKKRTPEKVAASKRGAATKVQRKLRQLAGKKKSRA
jgi:ribonuclease R